MTGHEQTAGRRRSWRRAIVADNPRGAIHGTILAAAVIAGTARHEPPGVVLVVTVATLVVFWRATVYTEALAHGLERAGLHLGVVPAVMGQELSMLLAPVLPLLFLAAAALDVLGDQLAGLVNGALGLVIVVLEALLH